MDKIVLKLPSYIYQDIMRHLLPLNTTSEQAAFAYAIADYINQVLYISFIDWELIDKKDFTCHTDVHLELSHEKQAQIIKKAHDLKASIVEWHSHPFSGPAMFSISDLLGFKEFVPHVMWRLAGRPYSAVVVTPNDLDVLVWINNSGIPVQPNYLKVGSRKLYPSGLTLINERSSYEREI